MGWTYINTEYGFSDGEVWTIDTAGALNVTAGDLLVAWCCWQDAGAGDSPTVDENDGVLAMYADFLSNSCRYDNNIIFSCLMCY